MSALPYMQPRPSAPQSLTFMQFIQTVFVGVSGLPGPMVRPKWQPEPPKQPDIAENWLAIGVDVLTPDANAFIGVNSEGATTMQRFETFEVSCGVYGPDALEIAGLIRDNLQVPNNREMLSRAKMGLVETSPERHLPDLVNQRWVGRYVLSVIFRREIQRVYPIPILVSASGAIHTVVGDEEYLLDWATQN